MSQTEQTCPGCHRHCPLSDPKCKKGEIFAKTGSLPGEKSKDDHKNGKTQLRYGKSGEHFNGDSGDSEFRHKHKHGKKHSKFDEVPQNYEALQVEEKLFLNMHTLVGLWKRGGGKGGMSRILTILSEQGAMSQQQLMGIVGIRAGSLSEVLGKLEASGWIRREANETDHRSMDVALTDAGVEEVQRWRDAGGSQRDAVFAALSEDEKATLLATLEKLNNQAQTLDVEHPENPYCKHGCRGKGARFMDDENPHGAEHGNGWGDEASRGSRGHKNKKNGGHKNHHK